MRFTLVVFIFALFASPSSASDSFSSYGTNLLSSCGKYVTDISTNPQAKIAYGWWVAGFVTGTNLEKGRVLATVNAAHKLWLKEYCEKNPLDPFMKAADELNKELDSCTVDMNCLRQP